MTGIRAFGAWPYSVSGVSASDLCDMKPSSKMLAVSVQALAFDVLGSDDLPGSSYAIDFICLVRHTH